MKELFFNKIKIRGQYSIYLFSVIVGVFSGLATMLLTYLLHVGESFIYTLHNRHYEDYFSIKDKIAFIDTNILSSVLIILLPAIGGLFAGLIIYYFCKDAAGTGSDEMINAFHNKEGNMSPGLPFFKSIATIFTIATGGSGGKEGPISQVGAGIGVYVSNLVKSGARARRTLMLAGTAAGLGAIFKAPLGGALTATEMVYKEDIESDALIPCFISSVTAYLIYTAYAGTNPYMPIGGISSLNLKELFFYIPLGLLCFLFGYLFIKGFKDAKRFIGKIKIHAILKPAIGGLLVGCISLIFFEVSGNGTMFLEQTFMGHFPVYFGHQLPMVILAFLLIAFLKIVATTLTIGSGGSAGIFGPSLFIGGMLGGAVGTAAQLFLPELDIKISSFVVVGMGAFYAGVANAPIAGIIMVCEMTGSYILLPPLILVSIFTFILSKKISFYKSQVVNRFKSPAHFWDMKFDIIESINISDKFEKLRNLAVVKDTMPFTEVQQLATEIHASDFVVIDKENNYCGMIKLRAIDYTNKKLSNPGLSASDFIDNSVPAVDYFQSLNKALNIIMQHDVDKVGVLKNNKIEGYIRSRDIFHAYSEAVEIKNKN